MTLEPRASIETAAGDTAMPALLRADPSRTPALRVGVVSGLGYRNLRGDLERMTRYLRGRRVLHEIVREPADLAAALSSFDEAGVDLVVVSGGDGTVSMAVTRLLNQRRPAPLLAVLEGGRTNMTARDVGLRGDQIRRLHRLLTWAEQRGPKPLDIIERPVIGVSAGDEPPECGFFVGGGAVYHGSLDTWEFRDQSFLPGMRTGIGTGLSVVKLVASHLVNRGAFAPSRLRMRVDSRPVEEEAWCVMFASTLRSLAFGIRPFWSEGPGRIRMTALAHDHRRLLRASWDGLRGRRGRHNAPELGYHSFDAESVELELEDGVTLDGQIIEAKTGSLRMSVAGSLRFLQI